MSHGPFLLLYDYGSHPPVAIVLLPCVNRHSSCFVPMPLLAGNLRHALGTWIWATTPLLGHYWRDHSSVAHGADVGDIQRCR